MKLLKRIVIFLLIVIPLTIHILQTRPLCSEANIHKVDGVVSDAYVVKLRGNTSSFSCILMEDGSRYNVTKGFARKFLDCSYITELKGKNISFMVEDENGVISDSKSVVAWNTNKTVYEESLKWTNTNRFFIKLIIIPSIWLLASPIIVTEIWRALRKYSYHKEILKKREMKYAKRQRQAEKYSSLEGSTEERYIQNKNLSKKKQKRRMKQNKPYNKN